jgi:hypothetical protein
MIAWLTTWSAAGWPNMSRPAFLLASAQITLEANTIWQLIWNHIGGWAAAAEAADTHRAAATAGRKAAVGAGSGASALSQGQAGQGQPRPQQYGQTGRWRYNSTVRTLYEEGVLANQQLLDAVLRNKQVRQHGSMMPTGWVSLGLTLGQLTGLATGLLKACTDSWPFLLRTRPWKQPLSWRARAFRRTGRPRLTAHFDLYAS